MFWAVLFLLMCFVCKMDRGVTREICFALILIRELRWRQFFIQEKGTSGTPEEPAAGV